MNTFAISAYAEFNAMRSGRMIRMPRKPIRFRGVPLPSVPGVYFVRSGVMVKIGHATDLQRRMQELQMGTFAPPRLIGYIEAPDKVTAAQQELELHRAFKDERVRGEWFRLTEAIVEALQRRGHIDKQALLL